MQKSGFTIVEIMVVIAIIWIITLLSTNFDFNKKSSIEKWIRITNKISSILKTEIFNFQSWKWVNFWSWIMSPNYTEIHLWTGGININYIWTKILTWEILTYPFFWENWYNISDIHLIEKDWSTWSIVNPFSIYINSDWITFSWSNAIRLSITAWYNFNHKSLELDRRTWIIEIK